MSKRFLAMMIVVAPAFCHLGKAAPNGPSRAPVQAELIKVIDISKVQAGDPILAKVQIEWKDPACNLRKGAILKGRVVSANVRSKTSKTSDLSILFESGECGGREMKSLSLTVAAMMAPDPTSSLYREDDHQSLSEAVGSAIGGSGSAGTGSGFSGGGGGLRSVQGAAATVFIEPTRYKPPKAVLPGQVIGIGGVKLSVGTGAEGSSVLSTSSHSMRLEAGSQFVLVPSPKVAMIPAGFVTSARTVTPSTPTNPTSSPIAEAVPIDETEVCTPPACSIALAPAEGMAGQAVASISVKGLGYALRGNVEMENFDYDAALAYLGPKSLLFTFNPHSLVPRENEETSPQMRTVRAVLIDLQTMKVLHTADWRVLDANQYLWPIANEKALAHVGRELRMYGPGLKLEQKVSLGGPLAFVRIAPSGKYIAVGIMHERHSRGVHQQLADAETREPEEDVELKVLTADFHVLTTVVRSSRDVPPVISDEGEIRIPMIGKNRWRIIESTWDGQRRVLALVNSTCRPEATTLQSNLLFLVGCDRLADGKWYRMLRSDGKPVLKGWSPSAELEQTANGTAATFAVGVAKASKPVQAETLFRATDLLSESIGVYGVENGQRKFLVSIESPVPTLQTFVLSPDGSQLAVLKGDQIAFYGVSSASESHK